MSSLAPPANLAGGAGAALTGWGGAADTADAFPPACRGPAAGGAFSGTEPFLSCSSLSFTLGLDIPPYYSSGLVVINL